MNRALAGKHYDLGIVEHFLVRAISGADVARLQTRTVLDLHNIESVLHARCAETSRGLVAAGHRRFAACYRRLEEELLPLYGMILATSETDATVVRQARARGTGRGVSEFAAAGARAAGGRRAGGRVFRQFRISAEYRRGGFPGEFRKSGPKCGKDARISGCVWWGAARGLSGICCLPDSILK